MSKTLIVAQREFVENLRTKTFWIGIFALPVIFALSIFISRFMQENKDVRRYAILDHSEDQLLSKAIDERAARTDLTEIAKASAKGSAEDQAAVRAKLAEWFTNLPPEHPIRDLMARLAPVLAELEAADLLNPDLASPELAAKLESPEVKRIILAWSFEAAQDPAKREALRGIAAGISLVRSRRVSWQELGIDPASPAETVEKSLNEAVNSGTLYAYFVIPPDPLSAGAGTYVSNNVSDSQLRDWFEGHATEVVRKQRIARLSGVTEADARSLLASFDFKELKVTSSGSTEAVSSSTKASGFAPVAFVYLLWIAVFTAAQMLLTNTVEEKSNRLIEVLLSSVSPMQLMSGKVLGIALTGLTIVVSWVVTAIVGTKLIPDGSPLAKLDLATIIGDPLYLTSFVVYFLAGYLLYAAILVALGSVCDSLKEAQNLLQPIFVLLIVPLLAMVPVVQDPNGMIAKVMTYIPIYTPFLMMNRAGGPPPVMEYVVSSVVIVVSLVIAFWAAGKIFRIGILMTGKPPRIREILGWLRAPVGAVHTRHDQGPTSP